MGKSSSSYVIGVLLLAAVPCAAQSAASIAIHAGSATDVTGAGANALTVAPSFVRGSALSTSTLGASATKFANDSWLAGLSGSFTGRATERVLTPVVHINAIGAMTSYDYSYATADLIPSLEAKASAARFFGGARLGVASTSVAMPSPTGTSPLGPLAAGNKTTTSNSSRSLIGGMSVSTVASNGEVATIGYRGETGSVAGRSQIDHGVSGSVAGSRVMFAAAIGRRLTSGSTVTHGSASVGIVATPFVSLQMGAGNYPSNPMIGTAAGRFVNAGLSMRIGRKAISMPAPTGVVPVARGMTRLAIGANDARRVELAGDFNRWQFASTTRAANGVWYVDLALPPGEYRYAFRIDGKDWRVPEGVAAADDEFGGKSAWLTVRQ